MVYVYWASCKDITLRDLLYSYKSCFPQPFIDKANAFKHEIDACQYLVGKLLIAKGMRKLGRRDWILENLEFDEFKKPYCEGDIHFNISHSGNHVICALSNVCTVGIDIEFMQDISMEEFTQCFTPAEWSVIRNADNPLAQFYLFWTKKESVIKADGRGLQIPLQSFDVLTDQVLLDSNKWYLKKLDIVAGYSAHIATEIEINGLEGFDIRRFM